MRAIPILTYHNVGEPRPGDPLPNLYVSPHRFARQMRLLSTLGFRGLSMSDALPYLTGQRTGRVAVLTFDDGYHDTFEQALPVLSAYGFTATCYIVSQCIGQWNRWDAAVFGNHKPLMNRDQINQWLAAGMEIGAHTRTHPFLTRCTDRALSSEILGCKEDLAEAFAAEIDHFAYPYGDWDERVAEVARQAAFRSAVTTQRGRAFPGGDPWRLPRVNVKSSYGLAHFLLRMLSDSRAARPPVRVTPSTLTAGGAASQFPS